MYFGGLYMDKETRREPAKPEDSARNQSEPKPESGCRLFVWLGKSRKNRIITAVAAVVVVGLLCAVCYCLGARSAPDDAQEQQTVQAVRKESREEEIYLVSEEAVTPQALSVQAVTPQGVRDAETDMGAVTNGQKTPQNVAGTQGASAAGADRSADGAQSASYGEKLTVVGNQLCTASGTPIQLRGVSTHGLSWFPEYVNEQMFEELKDWGANTVRLAMYTAEYNGYCTGDDANRQKLKQLVKQGVEYATRQNLYVIIDWHILSDGNPNTYKSQAVAFFAEMSQLYKDNDHVLYEICNEPNGGTGWDDIKSYAADVIAAIRANDADGIILVGTPTWSQELDKAAADPLTGYSNIMYTLHFYADTHRDALRSTLTRAVDAGLPVFVSEFGICDASGNGANNTAQADEWIRTLNQYGISYVAWSLCNKAESASLIQSGCQKVNGITENDLSDSGKWLLKTLQGSTGAADTAAGGNAAQPQETVQGNADAAETGSQQAADDSANSQNQSQTVTKTPEQYAPQASDGVCYTAVNSWPEGDALCIQYEIKVENKGGAALDGWSGSLVFPTGVNVVSGWNANFGAAGNVADFSAMDYNKTIQPGAAAEGIGCIVRIQ